MEMASQKDIADICGVSTSTVGKVLGGSREISEKTRMSIMEVASLLGYVEGESDDRIEGILRNEREDGYPAMIGISFDDDEEIRENPLYFGIAEGYRERIEEEGCELILLCDHKNRHSRSLLARIVQYKLAGVTFIGREYVEGRLNFRILERLGVASSTVGFYYNGVTGVISDQYTGMLQIQKYLHKCGHKNIAMICEREEKGVLGKYNTEAVFRSVSRCWQQGADEPEVYYCTRGDHAEFLKVMTRIMEKEDRPTCIICDRDWVSLQLFQFIHEAKSEYAPSLSMVCFEGRRYEDAAQYQITGTYTDAKEIGRKAAELMLQKIYHENCYVPGYVEIPPIFAIYGSVKHIYEGEKKTAENTEIEGYKRMLRYNRALNQNSDSE